MHLNKKERSDITHKIHTLRITGERRNNCAFCIKAFKVLFIALEQRDPYTNGHSSNVERLAECICRIAGFTEDEITNIMMEAGLHDIGKIGVPDGILKKPGKLTDEEYEEMKLHATYSIDYVKDVPIHDFMQNILHHHEKHDGSGYPKGLKGEDVPPGARIIALADSWDAMTTSRFYRKNTRSIKDALREIQKYSGTQFDPQLVKHFLKIPTEILQSIIYATH